jgi:hypothetical protein
MGRPGAGFAPRAGVLVLTDGEGLGMTGPLRVDVPVLRGLGSAVQADGAQVRRDVTAVGAALGLPPGPALTGWASAAALAGAARGWQDFLTGLAGRTTRAGQALVRAAENYRASDDRAAGRGGRGLARYE